MKIEKTEFGVLDQQVVYEYTLSNSNGLSLSVITYGGIITKIVMPDKTEKLEEITTNMTTLDEIVKARPFHGSIVGPVAGRISNARYQDGKEVIELVPNEKHNTLHGGPTGLDTKIWDAVSKDLDNELQLQITTELPDGENGFPGDVKVKVTYTLNEANEVGIHYEANTNKKTLFNPTNHVYFNLSGDYQETVYDHELQINSDQYAPLKEDNIPIGQLKSVSGTPFDLRKGERLETVILNENKEISSRNGLDHPFFLNHSSNNPSVKLTHRKSGRVVEVETDSQAIVVYTHNKAQESETGEDRTLGMHTGVTLETQQLPDAINNEGFGSIWLEPGQPFESITKFKFRVID